MLQTGHVFVDLHVPTFAYAFAPVNSTVIAHVFDWQFGGTVGFGF
jgi:hypothetical protein